MLFRWRSHLPAKHVGIASAADRFIHAYQRHAVLESTLVPQWRSRIAGVFRFPEIQTEQLTERPESVMATILLQAAGGFLGGLLGPAGAAIGTAVGALAGYAVDRALLSGTRRIEGPRLSGPRPFTAEDGASLPRVYGTARVGGTLIWATRFEETRHDAAAGRQGRAAGHRIQLFRQCRLRAVRGRGGRHPARLGRRARARPQPGRDALLSGHGRCRRSIR